MSSSLIWKSLQLFDADPGNKKGKKSDDIKNLIDTKRHGVKKEIKRLRREEKTQRSTILGDKGSLLSSLKRSSSASQGKKISDNTLENIKKLKELSSTPALELSKAEKILKRATGNKILLADNQEDTSTAFTEEDFAKFAKTYKDN